MSISLQHDIHRDAAAEDWKLRPEAEQAVQAIKGAVDTLLPEGGLVETATSVQFPVLYGKCTIRVRPLDIYTYDGSRLTERFDVLTTLTSPLDDLTDEFYMAANRYATTGTIVRSPESDLPVIASGASLREGDEQALRQLFVPTLLYSSLVQSFSVQAAMRAVFGTDLLGDLADRFAMPGQDEPSYWQKHDFESAASLLDSIGVYCNASETGLTAEFGWEPGTVSAMAGDRTSLMQFDNSAAHPTAGNGLWFALYLPIFAEEVRLNALAVELNNVEIFLPDVPPCFGAWAVSPDGKSLVYQAFWPNCMYQPGTVANIAVWCKGRSALAKRVIEQSEAVVH